VIAALAVRGAPTPAKAAEPALSAMKALDPVGLRAGAAGGPLMVVGAPMLGGGVVYVYTREAGAWRSARRYMPRSSTATWSRLNL
jgi:hypothetical protein